MSVITEAVIRKLDADHIERLIEENTTLKYAIDQQREDMAVLHQTIGSLEWKLQQRETDIASLKTQIERMCR